MGERFLSTLGRCTANGGRVTDFREAEEFDTKIHRRPGKKRDPTCLNKLGRFIIQRGSVAKGKVGFDSENMETGSESARSVVGWAPTSFLSPCTTCNPRLAVSSERLRTPRKTPHTNTLGSLSEHSPLCFIVLK